MEDACGDDQVVNAAKVLRGCGECRFSSARGGDVGIAAPPHRVHSRANSCELRGDRRANPRRPANYSDPSTAPVLLVPFGTCCLLWRDGLQLNQTIGEHVVNPRRDLDVLLGAINMQETRARNIAQDEGAIVGRLRALRRLRVCGSENAHNEPLRCLATSVEAAIRDVGDLLAINNDERVWRGDGGIHGIRAASNKWRDHALYNLARKEWAHRVVD